MGIEYYQLKISHGDVPRMAFLTNMNIMRFYLRKSFGLTNALKPYGLINDEKGDFVIYTDASE